MTHHETAIKILTARGFHAKRREWAPGSTIIVSRAVKNVGEIDQLDGMIILISQGETWDLQAPVSTPGGVIERGFPTVEACERAMEYLTRPEEVVWHAFRRALGSTKGCTLEYDYPDRMPLESPRNGKKD